MKVVILCGGKGTRMGKEDMPKVLFLIDDVINAYLALAEKLYKGKVRVGEAFNFGTGKPISVISWSMQY